MIPIGFKVFSVVAGGVLVGTLGAMHVNPVPKEPQPQWWQLTGKAEIAVDTSASGLWFEAGPDDLYVPRQDGYAPDWADDGEIWRYELPDLPEWEPDPLFASADAPRPEEPLAPAPPAVAEAAEAAAGAVEDAQAAGTFAAAEPASGEVRKSELAAAGLY